MSMFKKSLLAATILSAGSAFAATDGVMGSTSEGTSIVTLIKENVVQISNVQDLDLGSFSSLAADISAADDVCVFNSTSSYAVTVSSSNASFEMTSGTDAIPYIVNWTDGSNTSVQMVNGTAAGGMTGDQTSPNCNGTTNASFEVSVAATDFNSANPGNYTDTLTLMIEPE